MLATFEPPGDVPHGIRVVYSDLDGTMLGRAGSFLHDPSGGATLEPVRALLAAASAGIEVVPCSGRAMPGLAGDARLLGLWTAIGEMGAVIAYDGAREMVTALGEFPGGDATPVALMESSGAVAALASRFPIEPHAPWHTRREYTYLLRGLADVAEADAVLRDAGAGWCTLLDNGTLHGSYLGLPKGEAHVYHLSPRGVSKGAAISLDRTRRNLPREACIAIGDSRADLEMAAHVRTMILTSDALEKDPALAKAAEQTPNVAVTPAPGNLGWTAVLDALLNDNPSR